MIPAALHPDEKARQAALDSYDILDTEVDARFQLLVEQASAVCGVPVSLITLVDHKRQWFKAKVGVDVEGTPRDLSFCAHAILQEGVFEVPDARLDERFHDNPLVTGPTQGVFYAGVPIRGTGGLPLGTLCAIDNVPRTLDDSQRQALQILARQAEVLLEARQRAPRQQPAAGRAAAKPAVESARPPAGESRPSAGRSEQMAPVLGSTAWSGSGDVIAESLTDFFQMPLGQDAGAHGSEVARVATMVQLDTTNETALTLDLVIEVAFLQSFAAKLFGNRVDEKAEQAVLFETANIVMGAVKRAFEADGFLPTTGLPRERTAQAAHQELSQAGASQQHVFDIGGQRVSLSLGLRACANRTVPVAQLTEGMVLVGDVLDAGGQVVADRRTRLTTYSIARIAASDPTVPIPVGGAPFV